MLIGNRPIQIITPQSKEKGLISQQTKYTALDTQTQVIDGENSKTVYTLDGWGRITKVNKANGTTEQYTYDYVGNITTTTDGNGNTLTYLLDYITEWLIINL